MTAEDPIWSRIVDEVRQQADSEPMLASFLHMTVLRHKSLEAMLGFHLSSKLGGNSMDPRSVMELIEEAFADSVELVDIVRADIQACVDRDPACRGFSMPVLYFKGFQALQCYRVTHWLWRQGREALAAYFQNRISEAFAVDIHPAAKIGRGVLLDHGTGFVVGETAVVGDNVSILHAVTLGGTGKEKGDRHPKIGSGVLIGAGAKILGNVKIGDGAKIGAGSVVLEDVAPHRTVAGVPARVVGQCGAAVPAMNMDHRLDT